jgi:hypothetical protein
LFALRLPTARRGIPVIDRPQASKDVLIPF